MVNQVRQDILDKRLNIREDEEIELISIDLNSKELTCDELEEAN